MFIAHARLHGLDEDRIFAAVTPVLRAHGVEGVELIWRTDRGGWVLELTIERPESRVPGEGITVDLCSDISRDLSAALDVSDAIPSRYRLEVGSPGLDRALYNARDYERFAGQNAKLKLKEALAGERMIRGTLHGLDEQAQVLIETERGLLSIPQTDIEQARLVFSWNTNAKPGKKDRGRSPAKPGRGAKSRGPER